MSSFLRWGMIGSALWICASGSAQTVDLQADARLSVRVSLNAKSRPLAACLKALEKESGLRLTVTEEMAQRLAPALENNAALSRSYVGLIAAFGGLYVGIVGPDGKDVWVSPLDQVRRRGIPGYTSDNDMEPEVEEALAKTAWLDLGELPPAQRHRRFRFSENLPRHSLPGILEYLAAQTGLPFVSDDFIQSRRSNFFWLLTDRDEYTLEQALKQNRRSVRPPLCVLQWRDAGENRLPRPGSALGTSCGSDRLSGRKERKAAAADAGGLPAAGQTTGAAVAGAAGAAYPRHPSRPRPVPG
jgi:hypothetical protein